MKKFLLTLLFAATVLPSFSFAQPVPFPSQNDPLGSIINPVQTAPTTFSVVPQTSTGGTPAAGSTATASTQAATDPVSDDFSLDCGVLGQASLSQCLGVVVYGLFYVPSTWILAVGGYIFDAFTAYSLNSTVINASFVHSGWSAVRDIFNIVFIFLLLYIAINTILGREDGWKKRIALIAVAALFMNFSLFFAQVLVDVSNLAAYQFYNLIGGSAVQVRGMPASSGFEAHSISTRITSSINPQSIVGVETYQEWIGSDHNGNIFTLIVVFLAAMVINLVLAYALYSAAFLMLGRLVSIWVLMIFSPLAFIGMILPAANKAIGGASWWGMLTNALLLAPVFLFFLYLATFILGSGLFTL